MPSSDGSELAYVSTIHGIRLHTPFELWPGAVNAQRKWSHELRVNVLSGEPAPKFGAGELLAEALHYGERSYAFERCDTRVHFTFPRLCSGCIDLRQGQLDVHVQDLETTALVLPNTIMAVVVNEFGDLTLHGSAVRIEDQTWAFCGPSTAGKTTCAAALASLGASAVTDDLLRVKFDERGGPLCFPGVPELRVRTPRGWALPSERVRLLSDERTGFTPEHITHDVSPLTAIVFPIASHRTVTPELVRVQGEAAVRRLLQASRIAWSPRVGLGVLRHLSRLVQHVALYELHVCLTDLYQPSQRSRLFDVLTRQGRRGRQDLRG